MCGGDARSLIIYEIKLYTILHASLMVRIRALAVLRWSTRVQTETFRIRVPDREAKEKWTALSQLDPDIT